MALQPRIPTTRTVSGPKLTMEKNHLLVDYDWEADDGSVTWGRIRFDEVVSLRFWDNVSCPAENVLANTDIRVLEQSDYLDGGRARWCEAVGWQEWQREKGGPGRFQHFTVYFDDAGSLDVIAAKCHVDG